MALLPLDLLPNGHKMVATAISILSSNNCPQRQKVEENISQKGSTYVSLAKVVSHQYPQDHIVFDFELLQCEVGKGNRGMVIEYQPTVPGTVGQGGRGLVGHAGAQGLPTKHPRHHAWPARPTPDPHFLVNMELLKLLGLNLWLKVFSADICFGTILLTQNRVCEILSSCKK